MKKIIYLIVLMSLVMAVPALAGDSNIRSTVFAPIEFGARPVAMGGAYTALADDAVGALWNPAGLGYMKDRHLAAMYGNLYGIADLHNSFLGYAQPDKGVGAAGLALTNTSLTFSNDDQYSETMISYTFAKRMGKLTSLGFTLKGFLVNSDMDNSDAGGVGFDVGVIFRPFADAAFGFAIKDAYSELKWDGDDREKLPMQFRWGIAAMPVSVPGLVAAVDVAGDEDTAMYDLSIGGEYTVMRVLALRAGFSHIFPEDESRNLVSAGLGVIFYHFQVNYAFSSDDELDDTHRFDFKIKF